jgi:hypothetical protein
MQGDLPTSLTIIIFKSPLIKEPQEYGFSSDRICIGPSSAGNCGEFTQISSETELKICRNEIQLFRVKDRWFIENSQSKLGIFVNWLQIRKTNAIEISPGTPITTGETLWTFIPGDWIHIRMGNLLISGPFVRTISYVLYHCHIPILGPLKAQNFGDIASAAGLLTVKIGDGLLRVSEPFGIEVPQVDINGQISLRTKPIPLNTDILKSQVAPSRTCLKLELNDIYGRSAVSVEKELTVLGFWSWPYKKTAIKTVAAFVSPQSPVVGRIVNEAQKNIAGKNNEGSFIKLIHSCHKDAEKTILKTIYDYLKDRCRIQWLPPKNEGGFQNIRPAHCVFTLESPTIEGAGTCIDLAVLLSGCLERAELFPVIIFIGEKEGIPDHALVGCWTGHLGANPLIYENTLLQHELDAGNLLVVECTGLAEDMFRGEGKQRFEDATKSAKEQLAGAAWVCGVDICALRPKVHLKGETRLDQEGAITPMETAIEPPVVRAHEEARRLAFLKKREAIETTFLFYGWIAANGPIAIWLSNGMMSQPSNLLKKIQACIKEGNYHGEPHTTETYRACWQLSREIAQRRSSPSTQEQDLIWAILIKGQESSVFTSVCRESEIDLDQMSRLLSEHYPYPDIPPSFKSMPLDFEL